MVTVYDYWLAEKLISHRNDTKAVTALFAESFEAYNADFSDRNDYSGISDSCAAALSDKNLSSANKIMESCVKHGIKTVKLGDPDYPSLLADIECPPFMLFCKGNVSLLNDPFCVSMVGTRSMTTAGKYSAFKMGYELAAAGACIVSGMALGIDSMCHVGAMAAGGKTVAVLGSGVDVVYPKAHTILYNRIIDEKGLVISEFLPGTRPYGSNFPIRNRIIAGLSYSTVIVEATENSGALITAAEAIKEGRTAFAMPGYSFSAASFGTNRLIKSGARTATDALTVINEYSKIKNVSVSFKGFTRPTTALCERFAADLRVEAKVYDPDPSVCKINPEEILASADNAADFPFEVVQRSTRRKSKKNTVSEAQNPVTFVPEKPTEKAEQKQERMPTADELCSQCALFGVELDDEIIKVCTQIAENKELDVDLLHKAGCRTDAALQVLTMLSSAGCVEEGAGGKFKVCKITE